MTPEERKMASRKLLTKINRAFRKGHLYFHFAVGQEGLYDFMKTVSLHNQNINDGKFRKKAYTITLKSNLTKQFVNGKEYTGFKITCWAGSTATKG